MKKPIFIFALIVFLTASACGLPVKTRWLVEPTLTPAPLPQVQNVVTLTPLSPATAVPTLEPTLEPTITPTSAPTEKVVPDGVINIMVLGSDWRPTSGHRTDVVMLVSVNTVRQTVSAVSFPRDLYIPVPGWETQRINTVEPHGGFELLAETMDQNFGVRPDYYIMTDFQGFTGIINSLGGVDVYAGSRLADQCDLPWRDGDGRCAIQSGRNTMDGATALWYIRSRHTSNDLDRLRRQQEVMMGIFVKMMSMNAIQNLPGLFAQYQRSVKTNLTVQAITPLLPTAATVFSNRDLIRRYTLTIKEAQPFKTETGAQVLLPDYERIEAILDEAVFQQ